MGLVSGAIEQSGIPAVTLAMERGVAASRVGYVPFPYNFPMGRPEDRRMHEEVALAALGLLDELEEPGEVELPFDPW